MLETKVVNTKTGRVMKVFSDYEEAEAYFFDLRSPENHKLLNSTGSFQPKTPWFDKSKKWVPKQRAMTKSNTEKMNVALWTRSSKQLNTLLKNNPRSKTRRLIYYILSTRRGGR